MNWIKPPSKKYPGYQECPYCAFDYSQPVNGFYLAEKPIGNNIGLAQYEQSTKLKNGKVHTDITIVHLDSKTQKITASGRTTNINNCPMCGNLLNSPIF